MIILQLPKIVKEIEPVKDRRNLSMAVIRRIMQQSKTGKLTGLVLLALASSTIIVVSTTQIPVLLNQLYQ